MAGELNAFEYAELVSLINQKVPASANCPSCGKSNTVHTAPHLVTPVATSLGGGIALQAANYPQAMLFCTYCGYTRYFNVLLLKGEQ